MGTSLFASRIAALQRTLVLLYALTLPLSLTGSWIILILGLVLWAVAVVCALKLHTDTVWLTSWRHAPALLPLLAFAAAVTVSGAFAGGTEEAVASLWTLKALVVYFWSYSAFSQDRNLVTLAVCALLTVSALAGLWGTIQQLADFHPFSYPYLQATGFLSTPMAFAGQMQLFSLLALGLYLARGYVHLPAPFRLPLVFGSLTLANLFGVFFASERSAWLGVVLSILVLASALSWRTLAKSCLLLSVVVATTWMCVPVVKQRLYPLVNWQTDVSTTVRVFLWTESLRLWHQAPLTGIGIRQFPHFNIPEAIVPGYSKDINHAHSNYLHVLTTTGALGLATYLWLWIAVLKSTVDVLRTKATSAMTEFERALALGILAGTVSLLASGIFEYNFGSAQVRLTQWFVLAMLAKPMMVSKTTGLP